MTRRTAKLVTLAPLAACVLMLVTSAIIFTADRERTPADRLYIIGNASDPEMASVERELEQRLEEGESLSTGGGAPGLFAFLGILSLAWVVVGTLIVSRQPANWAGWIFMIVGAAPAVTTFAQALVIHGIKVDPGSVPLVGLAAYVGEFAFYVIALIPLLLLLYPDGRVPAPRWRVAVYGLLGGTGLAFLGFLLRPGPLNNWREDGILYENVVGITGYEGATSLLITVGTLMALASAASTVFGVRGRFKRSTGEDRQRMRVLALVASICGALLIASMLISFVGEIVGIGQEGEVPVIDYLWGLTALSIVIGVPVAYVVAIFRYRLWNLDIVIRKTVQYGILLTLFTALAIIMVAAIPTLVVGINAGTDVLPSVIVALILTMVFVWVRGPARRLADRIVYGGRATPYEVLSEFSERVAETYAADDVLPRMATVLGEGSGAEQATVWLRIGGEMRAEAVWPAGSSAPAGLPDDATEVSHGGETLGALSVRMPANDPMDPAKDKLVRDLAGQAGLVLRNVRLIEELRDSRRRLVAAQDEERRRIERNIHDGAQQQLVALAVQLKLVEGLVERDPARAHQLLAGLQTSTHDALEDLRDLARGIYPPLLADQGLTAALEAQARKAAVPTAVTSAGVGRYGQDVEATVYFCVLEALNNVAKYAGATQASVDLASTNGSLTFAVTDDGQGFDPGSVEHGTGLQGMADRVDAIGGDLRIESAPGRGTTITGHVPVERGQR